MSTLQNKRRFPAAISGIAGDVLPRPQDRLKRSAPVPGRSKLGLSRRGQVFQGLFELSRCCARGRAHSAFVVYPTVSSVCHFSIVHSGAVRLILPA